MEKEEIKQPLRVGKVDKRIVKGVGFNITAVSSEKGRAMLELQKDSRRQRHLVAMKECERFVEQFYDSFMERKQEFREKVKMFLEASDVEVAKIMAELTDEALLDNEIDFVNGAWDKIQVHRNARKEQIHNVTKADIESLEDF